MANKFQPRSIEIIDAMNAHGMGEPFTIELNDDERHDTDYIRFRQRIKNCADRLNPPRRVSINRKDDATEVIVTLLGEKN